MQMKTSRKRTFTNVKLLSFVKQFFAMINRGNCHLILLSYFDNFKLSGKLVEIVEYHCFALLINQKEIICHLAFSNIWKFNQQQQQQEQKVHHSFDHSEFVLYKRLNETIFALVSYNSSSLLTICTTVKHIWKKGSCTGLPRSCNYHGLIMVYAENMFTFLR